MFAEDTPWHVPWMREVSPKIQEIRRCADSGEGRQAGPTAPRGEMFPVGVVGFAGVGGTRRFDVSSGAIGEAGKMRWRLIAIGGRGRAIARHLLR